MRIILRNVFLILVTLVSLVSLQGCIFIAGAAAGAAGIAVVYDHRKLENIVEDQKTANRIADKILAVKALKNNSHIEVTVFNKIVLLTGQATTADLREQAGDIARSLPQVTHVYNQIAIKAPTSSLTRASDSWITTKIKTQMLAEKNLKSGNIKVVTENGTVYLMGIVSREQSDMAVDIARRVSGVQRVVKIFQYKN